MSAQREMSVYRGILLSTVSAGAVLSFLALPAAAQDADRPTFWFEIGGEMEHVSGGAETLSPPFFPLISGAGFSSPEALERQIGYTSGADAKVSFQPLDSVWSYSAALRFGRTRSSKHLHEQTNGLPPIYVSAQYPAYTPNVEKFSDVRVSNKEIYAILDFQVGKDVGVGSLTETKVSFGVRFAHLRSQSDILISARPDLIVNTQTTGNFHLPVKYHHTYSAQLEGDRKFDGVGPTLSWDGATSIMGKSDDGELTLDWGLNVGVLFGRQKTKVRHQTGAQYYDHNYGSGRFGYRTLYHHQPPDQTRTRSALVPNVGGFAGLSVRYPNVKLSMGYRVDELFGAIDGGIDTHKNDSRGFSGPFATISVGVAPTDF